MATNPTKKFTKKYNEYKTMINNGQVPDAVFTAKLLLLAEDVVKKSDDIAGPEGTVDYATLISQVGKGLTGRALGGITIADKTADRQAFLAKYENAIQEELVAKKQAADLLVGTITSAVTTALKLAI